MARPFGKGHSSSHQTGKNVTGLRFVRDCLLRFEIAESDRHAYHYPAMDLLGKLMIPVVIDEKTQSVDELGGLVRHSGEEYLHVLSGAMELHYDFYALLRL